MTMTVTRTPADSIAIRLAKAGAHLAWCVPIPGGGSACLYGSEGGGEGKRLLIREYADGSFRLFAPYREASTTPATKAALDYLELSGEHS